eukprot:TRINITY_DN21729_c0_g1_i1.p1 TRINITY_DN21729_c0_g1~~TRINITY_DN21729_c0_g1_i1.p1  ORF type:complete len:794 (-),score=141.67 TRINITY_DN21729_c0_g1_i1:22-2403(-)
MLQSIRQLPSVPLRYSRSQLIKDTQYLNHRAAARNHWANTVNEERTKKNELSGQNVGIQDDLIRTVIRCIKTRDLQLAKDLYSIAVARKELISNPRLVEAFVAAFAKCDDLATAEHAFHQLKSLELPSLRIYRSMIESYDRNHELDQCLLSLADMYHGGQVPNAFIWNLVLSSAAKHLSSLVLPLLNQMITSGVRPTNDTWIAVLPALSWFEANDISYILTEINQHTELRLDVYDWSQLFAAYLKENRAQEITNRYEAIFKRIEPDVVLFNQVIQAKIALRHIDDVPDILRQMESRNITPDAVTWSICINGASLMRRYDLMAGWIVSAIPQSDRIASINILEALARQSLFAKGEAQQIFDSIKTTSIMSDAIWLGLFQIYFGSFNAKLAYQCYQRRQSLGSEIPLAIREVVIQTMTVSGRFDLAMKIMREVSLINAKMSSNCWVILFKACQDHNSLKFGRHLEREMIAQNVDLDADIMNALVSMYGSCASIEDCKRIYAMIPEDHRTDQINTSIITAFLKHRKALQAQEFFQSLPHPRIHTATAMMKTYVNSGCLDEAIEFYKNLGRYNIEPNEDLKIALIDAFARQNRMDEAEAHAQEMPTNLIPWKKILGCCVIHQDITRGERIAQTCLKIAPGNPLIYRLLLQLYCDHHHKQQQIQSTLDQLKSSEKSVICWWENKKRAIQVPEHTFSDRRPARLDLIYSDMIKAGYNPQKGLRDFDSIEVRDDTELIALCLALDRTLRFTPVFISKNAGILPDSHLVCEYVSKTMQREITLWDETSFHHFKDGVCSCSS